MPYAQHIPAHVDPNMVMRCSLCRSNCKIKCLRTHIGRYICHNERCVMNKAKKVELDIAGRMIRRSEDLPPPSTRGDPRDSKWRRDYEREKERQREKEMQEARERERKRQKELERERERLMKEAREHECRREKSRTRETGRTVPPSPRPDRDPRHPAGGRTSRRSSFVNYPSVYEADPLDHDFLKRADERVNSFFSASPFGESFFEPKMPKRTKTAPPGAGLHIDDDVHIMEEMMAGLGNRFRSHTFDPGFGASSAHGKYPPRAGGAPKSGTSYAQPSAYSGSYTTGSGYAGTQPSGYSKTYTSGYAGTAPSGYSKSYTSGGYGGPHPKDYPDPYGGKGGYAGTRTSKKTTPCKAEIVQIEEAADNPTDWKLKPLKFQVGVVYEPDGECTDAFLCEIKRHY